MDPYKLHVLYRGILLYNLILPKNIVCSLPLQHDLVRPLVQKVGTWRLCLVLTGHLGGGPLTRYCISSCKKTSNQCLGYMLRRCSNVFQCTQRSWKIHQNAYSPKNTPRKKQTKNMAETLRISLPSRCTSLRGHRHDGGKRIGNRWMISGWKRFEPISGMQKGS